MDLKIPCAGVALLCALAVPAQAQEVPKWLADARAREVPLPAPTEVTSEDGWLRTQVPGAVKDKVVLAEGSYSLAIGVGDAVTVSCEVIRDTRDLAALLAASAELAFEAIEKLNGTVEARAVEASDAGAIGPHPFMALQWIYRASRQGEKRVGALKQFAAVRDDAVVYCVHDDLGYGQAFEAVTRALVTHLRTGAEPAPKPYFREISRVTLDGKRVGVAVSTLTRDADGDTKILNNSALLIQPVAGQLVSQDVSDVQWVRPDGSLINAVQAKAGNGKLSEDMRLQRGDDQRWRASGTIDGKAIDVELPAAPSSYIEMAKARRQLMAQAQPVGAHTESQVWSSLDLTRLLTSRATVLALAGADGFAVREELGGVSMEMVLDKATGTMVSARLPLGPRTMDFERILLEGTF